MHVRKLCFLAQFWHSGLVKKVYIWAIFLNRFVDDFYVNLLVRLLEWRKCTQKSQSENRSENAQRAVLCWEAKRKFVHVWLPDINDILMTNFKEAIKGWNLSSWKLYDFSRGRSWSKNHFRTLWLKLNKFCLRGMNPIPFSTVLRSDFCNNYKMVS